MSELNREALKAAVDAAIADNDHWHASAEPIPCGEHECWKSAVSAALTAYLAALPKQEPVHGVSCPKSHHAPGAVGYLHNALDDSPYDVDGVLYCGRCHYAMDSPKQERSQPHPRGVHNHGTEEGKGLLCREYLIGECMDVPKQEPSGWRPIESAPKDGTYIVLSNGTIAIQGMWWKEHGGMWSTDFTPTHWQPLPTPPNPPKGDEG